MVIQRNEKKNKELMKKRGLGFEDVMIALEERRVLYVGAHPNQEKYPHQKAFIVHIENYVYLVPYIQTNNTIFLKTIYPSRKLTKKYGFK